MEILELLEPKGRHQPPGVKRGFIKDKATRLLRTNFSQTTFEECLSNFNRTSKHVDILIT